MSEAIYLDNNATTRPFDEVIEAMSAVQRETYGNPSSVHRLGQQARHAIERARRQVAALVGARPEQIIFTSGGTESINIAIETAAWHPEPILTTMAEHRAVLAAADRIQRLTHGDVGKLYVDANGLPIPADQWVYHPGKRLRCSFFSITAANNETGVIADVAALVRAATADGMPVHVDAVQACGKMPVDVAAWGVEFASISAHKFHGPKGVGALYVRDSGPLAPFIVGGGQERGLRGGTENVAGIVGMGVAAERVLADLEEAVERMTRLRDRLETEITTKVPGTRVVAAGAPRICNTSCIIFEGHSAETMLIQLSEAGVFVSSGSACSSGSIEPSHVLLAMGIDERDARGAIRFSLSRFTTREEIDRAAMAVIEIASPDRVAEGRRAKTPKE